MKLIADSGSTKTDWRLIDDSGRIEQADGIGLNPNFTDEAGYKAAIAALKSCTPLDLVSEIWFYGAGCGSEKNREFVRVIFESEFPHATVIVSTDMLAAARALCGSQPGMAAILGTGMNTCVYNGSEIIYNHTSLGYVLGDEGSGAFFGKQLITDYLKNKLPEDLRQNFERRFPLSIPEIIENIYRKPLPNRFLAQFSKFIYQNLRNPYCVQLVVEGFRSFFREQIKRYPNWQDYQLNLTGSVAFYYSNLLQRVASEEGVRIGSIVEKPIAALALYHAESID